MRTALRSASTVGGKALNCDVSVGRSSCPPWLGGVCEASLLVHSVAILSNSTCQIVSQPRLLSAELQHPLTPQIFPDVATAPEISWV